MNRFSIRISYNAPFTLTFALSALCAFILGHPFRGYLLLNLFSVQPEMSWSNPLSYLRLFTHVLGHIDARHLMFNLAVILLLGPLLEEKYGMRPLLLVALITAFATGLVTVLLLPYALMGASGIAFALIVLSSFGKARSGTIPLTLVLVCVLFLGNEIWLSLTRDDNIAHFAHLIGGFVGGFVGFYRGR